MPTSSACALLLTTLGALGCSAGSKATPQGTAGHSNPPAMGITPSSSGPSPFLGESLTLKFTPRPRDAIWVEGQFTPFEVEVLGGPDVAARSLSCTTMQPTGAYGLGIWKGPKGALSGDRMDRRWLVQPAWVPPKSPGILGVGCEVRVSATIDGGLVEHRFLFQENLHLPDFDRPDVKLESMAFKPCTVATAHVCAFVSVRRTVPPDNRVDQIVECKFTPSLGTIPSELQGENLLARFSATRSARMTRAAELLEIPWTTSARVKSVRIACSAKDPRTWEVARIEKDVASPLFGGSAPVLVSIWQKGIAAASCSGCDQPTFGPPAGYHAETTVRADAGTVFVRCTTASGEISLSGHRNVGPGEAGKDLAVGVSSVFSGTRGPGAVEGPPPISGDVRCRAYDFPDLRASPEKVERIDFKAP